MGGMIMSLTSEFTMAPKAAPVITPMAKSTAFPRSANSRNSFSMASLALAGSHPCVKLGPTVSSPVPGPSPACQGVARARLPRAARHGPRCTRRSAPESRRASATDGGLHLLQGVEVLLQTVDVLLHVEDRRPELAGGTESARLAGFLDHVAELRLGAPVCQRAAEEPRREQRRDEPDSFRVHDHLRHERLLLE